MSKLFNYVTKIIEKEQHFYKKSYFLFLIASHLHSNKIEKYAYNHFFYNGVKNIKNKLLSTTQEIQKQCKDNKNSFENLIQLSQLLVVLKHWGEIDYKSVIDKDFKNQILIIIKQEQKNLIKSSVVTEKNVKKYYSDEAFHLFLENTNNYNNYTQAVLATKAYPRLKQKDYESIETQIKNGNNRVIYLLKSSSFKGVSVSWDFIRAIYIKYNTSKESVHLKIINEELNKEMASRPPYSNKLPKYNKLIIEKENTINENGLWENIKELLLQGIDKDVIKALELREAYELKNKNIDKHEFTHPIWQNIKEHLLYIEENKSKVQLKERETFIEHIQSSLEFIKKHNQQINSMKTVSKKEAEKLIGENFKILEQQCLDFRQVIEQQILKDIKVQTKYLTKMN